MKHEFEPTEGFEMECLICCGKHGDDTKRMFEAMDAMVRRTQVYMPIYFERGVTALDRQCSAQYLEHIVMFGGGR